MGESAAVFEENPENLRKVEVSAEVESNRSVVDCFVYLTNVELLGGVLYVLS